MGNERGKNILLGVLIVGLVTMTIAYAALQTQLKIGNNDTQVTVQGGTWDVHFETNSTGTTGSSNKVTWTGTGPQITNTGTVVEDIALSVNAADLASATQPITATYTFDIVNGGSIPAKVGSLVGFAQNCNNVTASTICSGVTYSLTYASNGTNTSGITSGQIVGATQNEIINNGGSVSVVLTINVPNISQETFTTEAGSNITIPFTDGTITFDQA